MTEFQNEKFGQVRGHSVEDMNERMNKLVLEPYFYIAAKCGKELRSGLIKAFNHWLNLPPEPLETIGEVIRMLHNASLIIDDIEDNSFLRRGQPAVHSVFGTPTAINSANFVYFLALKKLESLNHVEAFSIFSDQMVNLHRGQGMDVCQRCSYRCPTESEYCEMVKRKTGGLFLLAVRLMQLFSDNKTDYKPLLDCLGLLFQIRDDYINLVDSSYHKSKAFADDLTEGKFSFPVVRSINAFPDDNQVMSILYQHTTNTKLKQQCIRHMAELGALDYTVDKLAELESKCYELIEAYGGNAVLVEFVQTLGMAYRCTGGKLRRHYPSEFDVSVSNVPECDSDVSAPQNFVNHSKRNSDNNPVYYTYQL